MTDAEELILVWKLLKKFLLLVAYGKHKKSETLQNIGYLIINSQNLDVGMLEDFCHEKNARWRINAACLLLYLGFPKQ